MSEHEWSAKYQDALSRLKPHVKYNSDGTVYLTASAREIGIEDPIVFADIQRSIEETNRKIKAKVIEVGQQWSFYPTTN